MFFMEFAAKLERLACECDPGRFISYSTYEGELVLGSCPIAEGSSFDIILNSLGARKEIINGAFWSASIKMN